MASINKDITIKEYQAFVEEVYGASNDRYFGLQDMITNLERFAMRALKGIRKNDQEKIKINLLISLSWFMSTMNQLHIDLENETWKRFPCLCSYCASCPCACKEKKIKKRQNVPIDEDKRPKTLKDFQKMFSEVYPPSSRSLEHAGVHLAEEVGELGEAILTYRGGHQDNDFEQVAIEAADLFSCFVSTFNSLETDISEELSKLFADNCHVCHKAPCACSFSKITKFVS